jgi:hypothetical protein
MEKHYLGFEYQPYLQGSCGAYSFGHALNLIGIPHTIGKSKLKI